MRMKFNKSGQLLLAAAASLLVAGVVTACGTLTVDFVFVTSSKAAAPNTCATNPHCNDGEVDVFEVNSESGFMRQIPTSPFLSGGRNPVADVVSTDYSNLYVVNRDDNTIVQFVIGNDGKLYPQNTVNTPGVYPLAVAVAGSNLFVVDTYQPLPSCSTAAPCSGSVAVFPVTVSAGSANNGALGSPVANGSLTYWPLSLSSAPADVIVPTAINVLKSGASLFVTAYDSSVTPNVGYVFGFSIASSGSLTPLNGGVPHDMGVGGMGLGIHPSAIASYSTGNGAYIYVTDSTNGIVVSYSIASGVLTKLSDTPTGNAPTAIVVDPAYPYAYVANSLDGNVEAYSISSSGALTFLGGSANPVTYATGLQPVAMGIDPCIHHFLYTAQFSRQRRLRL